ncbi:DUF3618 domain-containing protein [Actinophytocola gossypii]|uniref:DUF3618 domain-containing protein n=1 Tax=Actinophytocola gossypii TaxID=2812003 RepID=A0ABT2J1F7_9PSEU|nr:DUF3618 domain-containing protein [Actinophytocola gossypii]MCT2581643.1 DUF3618 domain-containing protein [Actinophytocola gossypii]
MTDHTDRMVMPGGEPTDEDLRHDVELTREELAHTVAALGEKADVKGRVRAEAHRRAEHARTKGDELVGKLPDPVATKVAPAWHTASHRPAIPLGTLAALIAALLVWLKIRKH